jgi:hypothetical protein
MGPRAEMEARQQSHRECRNPRGVEDLVVRVWGKNANGKAFSQSAYARNLAP